MKKLLCLLLCFLLACGCALAELSGDEKPEISYADLLMDLVAAYRAPSENALARIDADTAAMGDELASAIAENWKRVWLNPDDRLYLYGADDPSLLPAAGRHAFVVLGYELKDGEMTEELIGRCDAAAAAARAFPDAVLVCSGGATGENNPEQHTEAGLMKAYLTETCGIAPERVLIDESAMTTAENARNTMAILKENGIETMTIVTSSYHQRRGQTLYHALACRYRTELGYAVEIVGNYCYDVTPEKSIRDDSTIAALQLGEILELPEEQMERIRTLMERRPPRENEGTGTAP